MKRCSKCQRDKARTEFYSYKKSRDGLRSQCKDCYNRESRARWARMPTKPAYLVTRRNYHLNKKYGLTAEQYESMLDAQGGRCFLCRRTPLDAGGTKGQLGPVLQVDHDHGCCPGKYTCGACLRKLLCVRCNRMISWVEAIGVENLAAYLN